jgi:hypothetical protein
MNADLAARLSRETPQLPSPLYALPSTPNLPRRRRSILGWIRSLLWALQSKAARHHRFTGTIALFFAGCAFTTGLLGGYVGLGATTLFVAWIICILLFVEGVVFAFPNPAAGERA